MKWYLLLILILIVAFLALMGWDETGQDKDLCLKKGGIPIMNWNESQLKDCKFK